MANFDFDQSTALPWDLQRHLEALLAGQAQTQTPGGGGAGSYRESGGGRGEPDELFQSFLFDEPTPGGPSRRAGFGGEVDGDGAMTPFARSSLQVPFFRWVSPSRAQIIEGGGGEGEGGSDESYIARPLSGSFRRALVERVDTREDEWTALLLFLPSKERENGVVENHRS